MNRRSRNATQCYTGLSLILLILGGEAARINKNINVNSYDAAKKAAYGQSLKANQAEREKRSADEQWTDAERAQDMLASLNLEVKAKEVAGAQGVGVEVARGWLTYKGVPTYAVLQRITFENTKSLHNWTEILTWQAVRHVPGAGVLMLYTLDSIRPDSFRRGREITSGIEPWVSLLIHSDDAVMMEKSKSGNKLRMHGEIRSPAASNGGPDGPANLRRKGVWGQMQLTPVAEHFSALLIGDARWLEIASADDTMDVWMNAVRMLQTVGTCLEDGTCLVQCTYIESIQGCNYPAFCTHVKKPLSDSWWSLILSERQTKSTCKPKVTKEENIQGWKDFQAHVISHADSILESGCMATCQASWEQAIQGVSLAIELKKQYQTILDTPDMLTTLPFDTVSALKDITQDIDSWIAGIADRISRGFDYGRTQTFNLISPLLTAKGCSAMPKGSIKALLNLNSAPDDDLNHRIFQVYEDRCPWFKDLAAGDGGKPDEDAEFADQLAEDGWKHSASIQPEWHGNNHLLGLVGSFIQNGTNTSLALPLADILIITAVVSTIVMILAGVSLIIKGAFCTSNARESGRATNGMTPHQACKQHLATGSPCWVNTILPGLYMVVGGFVVLALTGVAVFALAAPAAAWTIGEGALDLYITGGATAGGGLGLAGIYRVIRSWFPNAVAGEDAYARCMTKLKEVMPTPELPMPAKEIAGLRTLFETAILDEGQQELLEMDLQTLHIANIDELELTDWTSLRSWAGLSKFEKKRLCKALFGAAQGCTG